MKAEVAQQRSLLEVAELDAELAKMDHRAGHLPERADCERIQTEQVAANDRLGALQIALEDLNTQVSRFESEGPQSASARRPCQGWGSSGS